MSDESESSDHDTEGLELWHKVIATVKSYTTAHKPAPPAATPRGRTVPAFSTTRREKTRTEATPTASRGTARPDARLDLHGMNQEQAFRALNLFLAQCWEQRVHTALVITGKGADKGGILRRMAPLWMENAPWHQRIASVAPAAPKDGGNGALCIRFKKQR